LSIDQFNGYAQGFIADIDSRTAVVIPYVNGRIEGDALILLVISSYRLDRSAANE